MPAVPPPPSPALLRRALGEWRRDRRGAVAAAVLLVLAGAALAVVSSSGPAGGDAPGVRELATAALTAAVLTTVLLAFVAHVGVARLGWFRHVARFPRLLAATLRVPGAAPRALAGLAAGIVLATFVHPVLGLATAALAIAVLPTDVGRALAVWRTAGRAARDRVAGRPVTADPDRWRLTALTTALGVAPVALLRLLVLEPACTLDRVLGAACPAGAVATSATAVAVAVGAVAVTPLALGLGDVLARSLAGESFGAPPADLPPHVDVLTPSPPPTPPASPASPVFEPGDVDVPEPAVEQPEPAEPPVEEPALEE
ncbi:MAG: hypothetical protein KY457_12005, partial [Actinobacteria bacterium]|nr:hypothetical protein [Actinomycetota bacterium]